MSITLSDEARKQALASIRRYFEEELEQEIGDLKAQMLLDFFLKEIAPSIYNGAVSDAQIFIRDRTADLTDVAFKQEFAYWPATNSVRRKR
jgi:uncharacterized protein (DUF2164 family)